MKQLEAKHGVHPHLVLKLQEIHSFLSNPQNKVFILHDNDCDGLLSYLILQQTYPSVIGGHFISKELESQEIAIKDIPQDTTHILFIDTPNINFKILEEVTTFFKYQSMKVYILDHHVITPEMKDIQAKLPKLNYTNPLQFNTKDSRPATFWAYLLSNESPESFNYALIGTVSDFYTTTLFNQIDETSTQIKTLFHPFDLSKLTTIQRNLQNDTLHYSKHSNENADIITELSYTTKIGELKQFFDFIFKNAKEAQDAIKEIKQLTLFDILGHISSATSSPFHDFSLYMKKYSKILQKAYNKFEKQENKDYIIMFHRGKTSYNRQLSEKSRFELDVKLSCSMHQKYERESIAGSFRTHHSLSLHEILPEIFKGLNGTWGGHPNACGFQIPEDEKEILIQRIEECFMK